jgi:hypothetical protein
MCINLHAFALCAKLSKKSTSYSGPLSNFFHVPPNHHSVAIGVTKNKVSTKEQQNCEAIKLSSLVMHLIISMEYTHYKTQRYC